MCPQLPNLVLIRQTQGHIAHRARSYGTPAQGRPFFLAPKWGGGVQSRPPHPPSRLLSHAQKPRCALGICRPPSTAGRLGALRLGAGAVQREGGGHSGRDCGARKGPGGQRAAGRGRPTHRRRQTEGGAGRGRCTGRQEAAAEEQGHDGQRAALGRHWGGTPGQ